MKRRMLWIGFFAVFVPLSVLLGLQYKWLVSLEKTSAIAEKAWLDNYLEAVAGQVEYFYSKQAERALNIPPGFFAREEPKKIAKYFRKKKVEGARYLFAAKFPKGEWEGLYAYDPSCGTIAPPGDPAVLRAITVALAPWKTLSHKGGETQVESFVVEEKDPDNRMILAPITDDWDRIIGLAGMIIDSDHFEQAVLPKAIKKSMPKFFDEKAMKNLIIEVRDGRGRLVFGSAIEDRETKPVVRNVSSVFSDWKIALGSRYTTPDQLARRNFMFNISLSIALAVVLLGGIVLALRTASREMRLSQMKSDFVSNVSHELRTPLASIRVFGEFLRLGRVRQDEKTQEYGEFIETESRRLTQLINNILDFSKIESGAKTYDFELADVQQVLADTLRTLDVSLKHKGFRLTYEIPDRPLPRLRIDPDAMGQAMANLVDNAVKYSDGSKEIGVTLKRDGGSVVIAVRDQGIGISRDEQQKIFERFHRVSTGLVHDVKGSGLGLSIVNHIVEAHSGQITVESEPGRGSTFYIHLPLPARAAREEAELAAAQEDSVEQVEQMGNT